MREREKIVLSGASKRFPAGGKEMLALQPTDLMIRDKEFVALVGPSGCGKSTVLNMIAGLTFPSQGQVLYDGQPLDAVNRDVGYITQKDTLLPWRTAAENIGIAFELARHKVSRSEKTDRVAQMVKLVGLKGFENHYPNELSGGMRKRAALARTLVYQPDAILLDEPFGALDAQLKLIMQQELLGLTRDKTVVFVTHDLGEAIALANRVVVFAGRPGYIKSIYDVDIATARDVDSVRFTPQYAALYQDIWNEMKSDVIESQLA